MINFLTFDIMSKEIRRVSPNWKHPKYYNYYCRKNIFKPMKQLEEKIRLEKYMPLGNWWQLFETVSEGTPISPPFPTKNKLINWMLKNGYTKESAEYIINKGSVCSGVMINGILGKEEDYFSKNTIL